MAYKGRFKPKNFHKYKGDPTKIVYRSYWEAIFMNKLDKDPSILEWSSEEMCIPYVSPKDNRVHRYFPDFIIKKETREGPRTFMIEIKPDTQTRPPKPPKRKSHRYLTEVVTYGVNTAKWKAARAFCAERKWNFVIVTEYELGLKKR